MREWALEIEIPPTGNHRHAHRGVVALGAGGRGNTKCPRCTVPLVAGTRITRTREYEAWSKATAKAIEGKFGKFDGPVTLYLWIMGGVGFREDRDLDNCQKSLGDCLGDSGIVASDDVRSVKSVRLYYFTRAEHLAMIGGGRKKDEAVLPARAFLYLTPSVNTDPWAV